MNPKPLLEVRDLQVNYGKFVATKGISFTVKEGEALGIVGESGSGKSTVGRALLGLATAKAGTITFAGQDITHLDRRGRQRISQDLQVVFQDPRGSLNEAKRVRDILIEPLVTNHQLSKREAIERACTLLERVGLDRDAMNRLPGNFSGGQRQRIAIARALMPRPRLVICDEPVSALDLSVQAQIMNLFLREKRENGTTYVFIAHNLAIVRILCENVLVMSAGRVVEAGSTEQVYTAPEEEYTKQLLAAEPHPDPAIQRQRRKLWQALNSTAGDQGAAI